MEEGYDLRKAWSILFKGPYVDDFDHVNKLRTKVLDMCSDEETMAMIGRAMGVQSIDICGEILRIIESKAAEFSEEMRSFTIFKWHADFRANEWVVLRDIIQKHSIIYGQSFPKAGTMYDLLYDPETGLLNIESYIDSNLDNPTDFLLISDKIRLKDMPNALEQLKATYDRFGEYIESLKSRAKDIEYDLELSRRTMRSAYEIQSLTRQLEEVSRSIRESPSDGQSIKIGNLRSRLLSETEMAYLIDIYSRFDVRANAESINETILNNIDGFDNSINPDQVLLTDYEISILDHLHKLVVKGLISVTDPIPVASIPYEDVIREDISKDVKTIQAAIMEASLVQIDYTPNPIRAALEHPLELEPFLSSALLERDELEERIYEHSKMSRTPDSIFMKVCASIFSFDGWITIGLDVPFILTQLDKYASMVFLPRLEDLPEITTEDVRRIIQEYTAPVRNNLKGLISLVQDYAMRGKTIEQELQMLTRRNMELSLINYGPIGYYTRGSLSELEHRNMLAWVNAQADYIRSLPIETKAALVTWQVSSQIYSEYMRGSFDSYGLDDIIMYTEDTAFGYPVEGLTRRTLDRFIKLVNNAILNAPELPHSIWTYKGLWGNNPYVNAEVGETLTYHNFMAVTAEREIAESFLYPGGPASDTAVEDYRRNGRVCCLVKFMVPRRTRCLYLYPVFSNLSELLFGMNIPATITNAYTDRITIPNSPLRELLGDDIKLSVIETRFGLDPNEPIDIVPKLDDDVLWEGALRECEEEIGVSGLRSDRIHAYFDFRPYEYDAMVITPLNFEQKLNYMKDYITPFEFHVNKELLEQTDIAASGILFYDVDSKEILLLRRTTDLHRPLGIPGGGTGPSTMVELYSHKTHFKYRTYVYLLSRSERDAWEQSNLPNLNNQEHAEHDAYIWIPIQTVLDAIDRVLSQDLTEQEVIDILYPNPKLTDVIAVANHGRGEISLGNLFEDSVDGDHLHPGVAFAIWNNRAIFDSL